MDEELKYMREQLAIEKNIVLFREYTEVDAAAFLGLHERTLAGMRRAGNIWCVKKSERNISYLGLHIVDYLLKSANLWPISENSKSASTGSRSKAEAPTGVERGTAKKADKQSVQALAQATFKTPSKS